MAKTAEAEEELQAQEPAEPPRTAPVEIDLDGLDDADDGTPDVAAADDKPSRRDRRATRNTEHIEKRAAEIADSRTSEYRREIAELRGRVEGMSSARPSEPVADKYELEIDDLQRQQNLLVQSLQSETLTEPQVMARHKQWRDLENKAVEARTQRAVERQWSQRSQENPQEVENRMLRAEYPDIFDNEPMRLRALAELKDMSEHGKPINIITAREAAETTRRRYGTGKSAAPSDIERQRYMGTSAQAGASGASRTFTPTLGQLRTARAYTSLIPDLTDDQRVTR